MRNTNEFDFAFIHKEPIVLFISFPGMCMFDMAGPQTVFSIAAKYMEKLGLPGYQRHTVSENGGLICSLEGTTIHTLPLSKFSAEQVDTIIVPGAPEIECAVKQSGILVEWLGSVSGTARRTASVCNGSYFLAEAGLLEEKRAATHWTLCDQHINNPPSVEIARNRAFSSENKIWTSEGIAAGIDLSLALIQADYGHEFAAEVARELAVF